MKPADTRNTTVNPKPECAVHKVAHRSPTRWVRAAATRPVACGARPPCGPRPAACSARQRGHRAASVRRPACRARAAACARRRRAAARWGLEAWIRGCGDGRPLGPSCRGHREEWACGARGREAAERASSLLRRQVGFLREGWVGRRAGRPGRTTGGRWGLRAAATGWDGRVGEGMRERRYGLYT